MTSTQSTLVTRQDKKERSSNKTATLDRTDCIYTKACMRSTSTFFCQKTAKPKALSKFSKLLRTFLAR